MSNSRRRAEQAREIAFQKRELEAREEAVRDTGREVGQSLSQGRTVLGREKAKLTEEADRLEKVDVFAQEVGGHGKGSGCGEIPASTDNGSWIANTACMQRLVATVVVTSAVLGMPQLGSDRADGISRGSSSFGARVR